MERCTRAQGTYDKGRTPRPYRLQILGESPGFPDIHSTCLHVRQCEPSFAMQVACLPCLLASRRALRTVAYARAALIRAF